MEVIVDSGVLFGLKSERFNVQLMLWGYTVQILTFAIYLFVS